MQAWTRGRGAWLGLGLLAATLVGGWWAAALEVSGPLPTQGLTSTSLPTFAGIGIGTAATADALTFSGQGARTLSMARQTTADTAGAALTIQAGGATVGATSKAGGDLLLKAGIRTGADANTLIRLQVPAQSSVAQGATTDVAFADRLLVGVVKGLTNNSAIPVLTLGQATSAPISVLIAYSVEVYDGTASQIEVGQVLAVAQRSSGANTSNISKATSLPLLATGSLTVTWSISTAQPVVVSLNANSSLTPASGFPRVIYSLQNFGQGAVALQ